MTWSDLSSNWGAWRPKIKSRFPHLDDDAMPVLCRDRARFEAYLAEKHDLTLTEAREELEDFFYVEGLAAEIVGTRAHG